MKLEKLPVLVLLGAMGVLAAALPCESSAQMESPCIKDGKPIAKPDPAPPSTEGPSFFHLQTSPTGEKSLEMGNQPTVRGELMWQGSERTRENPFGSFSVEMSIRTKMDEISTTVAAMLRNLSRWVVFDGVPITGPAPSVELTAAPEPSCSRGEGSSSTAVSPPAARAYGASPPTNVTVQ